MQPEVGDVDLGALGVSVVGQQQLTSVAGRHDPRRSVHRRAEVVTVAQVRKANMDCHPGLDRDWSGPRLVGDQPLDLGGSGNGIGRAREGCGEAVACGREDDPGPSFDRIDHQLVVS